MNLFPLLSLIIGTGMCSSTLAAECVLFDPSNSIGQAPIVIANDAAPRTREAAGILADYLQKITGAKPQLIEGVPQPLPPHAIWVGVQPAVKTLFPKTDFDFGAPEETLIAANADHLVIAGRDRWDPQHVEEKGRSVMKTGLQQEYGTANAVFTFLRDQLGVRWLWPGEEDVPSRARLAFAPFEQRYHPQIRARAGMLERLSLGDSKEGPQQLWARYQRVQLDSSELLGDHAFNHWWDKYHEQHPDYFALWPDGTRRAHPEPKDTKLCESNRAVWRQWLAEVDEQLRANPLRRVFNASENDGYTTGQCTCEKCRANDAPEAEKFMYSWPGSKPEERPALSDRQVIFANHLARLLRERYPDQELFVQMHAYGYSCPAPIHVVPDDNVIISSVANFHLRGDGGGDERTKAMAEFAGWAKKAKHIMWRPNLGIPGPDGLHWGMPEVSFRQTAEDFRFLAENHCEGIFFDLLDFHWSTQGPYYYLLAHLAWNPRDDANAIMDDYYTRAFGPAAPEMKAYWELLEKTRDDFVREVHNRYRLYNLPTRYTPELFTRLQALLDAADVKAAGADEKYRRRLAYVRSGFDFTKLLVSTRAAMQKLEGSKGTDAEAKAAVLANWETADRMRQSFPPFAINWQTAFRAGNRYVMGLHPDTPLAGRPLRLLNAPGFE